MGVKPVSPRGDIKKFVRANKLYTDMSVATPDPNHMFICKTCRRPFARQDALTRHEKLHVRAMNADNGSTEAALPLQPASITSHASWETSASTTDPASTSETSNSWDDLTYSGNDTEMHHVISAGLDFTLVWPDLEDLFRSLMSTDASDQWHMPLGTLPFLPVVQDVKGVNFGSPSTFDDHSSSVGAIPRGGGHRPRDLPQYLYVAMSLAGAGTVNLPRNTVRQDALLSHSDLNIGDQDIRPPSGSETKRFVEGGSGSPSLQFSANGSIRTLLYVL
ncbi:uncharacterized protein N7515_002690 [Penicillium bovifimosum]|uniref:C2H2-type domain-containing protein n=1 Tax=Penicillium bovifimosum TaxID=126998 RepID=A0A9W9HEB1_9EURO|nr:uncharacterized protein N7515_002690 [Penicillium bovifimosum]KAJ5143903.1 hypothetical protein N7515_002690 [Penicillium bovifimosum]